MKIVAVQTSVSKDVSMNAALIRQVISDAAIEGVRLVSFCEGALSGIVRHKLLPWTIGNIPLQKARPCRAKARLGEIPERS